MKRRILMGASGVLALSVAACSTTVGNNFHSENVGQLVPGKTTLAEAQALLGKPVGYHMVSEGHRLVSWYYVRGSATIIPGVSGGEAKKLGIEFDENNTMVRIVGQTETHNGPLG